MNGDEGYEHNKKDKTSTNKHSTFANGGNFLSS
jgi:hypothetical protein